MASAEITISFGKGNSKVLRADNVPKEAKIYVGQQISLSVMNEKMTGVGYQYLFQSTIETITEVKETFLREISHRTDSTITYVYGSNT